MAKKVGLLVVLLAVLVKPEGMDGVKSVVEPLAVLLAVVKLERMDGVRVRSVARRKSAVLLVLLVLLAVGVVVLLISIVMIDEVLQDN